MNTLLQHVLAAIVPVWSRDLKSVLERLVDSPLDTEYDFMVDRHWNHI